MIQLKTPEEIDRMAAAGRILARCHEILRAKARPGVTTAVICMTGGGGPAWPRATPTRILAGMGVARRTHPPLLCLARIKQRRPTRATVT